MMDIFQGHHFKLEALVRQPMSKLVSNFTGMKSENQGRQCKAFETMSITLTPVGFTSKQLQTNKIKNIELLCDENGYNNQKHIFFFQNNIIFIFVYKQ